MDMDYMFVDYLFNRYRYEDARKRAFDFVFDALKTAIFTAQEAEIVINYILQK